jgi:hypothetical protein
MYYKNFKSTVIALVAATVLSTSAPALGQWDPYGYHYSGPVTRYTIPSDQIHWYVRSPVDFNT